MIHMHHPNISIIPTYASSQHKTLQSAFIFMIDFTRQQQYRVQSFNRAVVLLQTAYKPSCSCYKG